jgi:RecJ-like exonuclease
MSRVDQVEYRGSARTCPSCNGMPEFNIFGFEKKCKTCNGTGRVHTGIYCPFCGRSVQFEYKGLLICGSIACETEADKPVVDFRMGLERDEANEDAYAKLLGMI